MKIYMVAFGFIFILLFTAPPLAHSTFYTNIDNNLSKEDYEIHQLKGMMLYEIEEDQNKNNEKFITILTSFLIMLSFAYVIFIAISKNNIKVFLTIAFIAAAYIFNFTWIYILNKENYNTKKRVEEKYSNHISEVRQKYLKDRKQP